MPEPPLVLVESFGERAEQHREIVRRQLLERGLAAGARAELTLSALDASILVVGVHSPPGDLDRALFELRVAERAIGGVPVLVFVHAAAGLPERLHPGQKTFETREDLLRLARRGALSISTSTRLRPTVRAIRWHRPAVRPDPKHLGMLVADMEVLLTWAERYVADEANPKGQRDEVDARRRQMWEELRLIEQGRGSSFVLSGLSGALLALVRPPRSEDGLGAAADEVADGVVAYERADSDDDRAAASEEVAIALDHVGEEVAEVIEANGWDDLKASMWRTAGLWVEEDFRTHLNAFITATRERALPAGGGVAAGGAAVGLMGGPPWLAVTIVAAGLLRSLFPRIFPRRTPPEDPTAPEEG